ncbi:MAG: hypothetical protein IAF38_13845 [Bacteroidia bacterium]|nr:hypothetical protein [Bacteroidia bacterium]
MRTLISCLFSLFIANSFSQPGALDGVVKKLDVNIGGYDNKLVFLSQDIYSMEFEFKVFNIDAKKIERTIKFKPKLSSMISTFIFKGSVGYAYYGGASMTDRISILSSDEKLYGMKEPAIVKINFETSEIVKEPFTFREKPYFSGVYPFFNPDSSSFGFYYLAKVSKKTGLLKVLLFDMNLKQTDEISFPVSFNRETGDFKEEVDKIMNVAYDNEKNIKVLFRHELEKKDRKALAKTYKYTFYEYDYGKKKIDSAEVLGSLKSHRDQINWVWDKDKKNCFIATYLSAEPRAQQTGAHFEKYSGAGKSVIQKDFMFTLELMNKFRKDPSEQTHLADFRFDGFHITPSGNLYLVGESFEDLCNYGVYRDEFMYNSFDGGVSFGDGYGANQKITSGPLMVFHLKNDMEVDWVKEFDKCLITTTDGGTRPDFQRGQKSFVKGEILNIFFPDLLKNKNLIEGHPFTEKDSKTEGSGDKSGVFQLIINETGKAEKKLLYTDDKPVEAKDLLSYPVHFPCNKKYFFNFKTVVPVF